MVAPCSEGHLDGVFLSSGSSDDDVRVLAFLFLWRYVEGKIKSKSNYANEFANLRINKTLDMMQTRGVAAGGIAAQLILHIPSPVSAMDFVSSRGNVMSWPHGSITFLLESLDARAAQQGGRGEGGG